MKRKIICGNWKMNTSKEEAVRLASEIEKSLPETDAEVVVCPPFVYLDAVKSVISRVKLGAQNCYFEKKGAFTGEVSAKQIAEYCDYVILGHSERRRYQKETDEEISKKTKAALEENLLPIICVGETKEERESGKEKEIVSRQVEAVISNFEKEEAFKLIFAYEPVWAIGTGEVCSVSDAVEVVKIIRETIDGKFGSVSGNIPILYGGSVSEGTIEEFAKKDEIDGVLVGGASLKADEFLKIIEAYK